MALRLLFVTHVIIMNQLFNTGGNKMGSDIMGDDDNSLYNKECWVFEATDWPSQEYDMFVAAKIIGKHFTSEHLQASNLYFLVEQQENGEEVELPEWVQELAAVYVSEYGLEYGQIIISKVLTKFLIAGQTLH